MSEIGDRWGPAVVNTTEEFYFIKEGQKSLSNSYPYWIGGSTDIEIGGHLILSDYIANNSGNNSDGILLHTSMTQHHWSKNLRKN